MTSPENLRSMGTVTNLSTVDADLDHAVRVADAAAAVAGVSVREVTDLADLESIVRLSSSIWGRDANPPMTLELLPDRLRRVLFIALLECRHVRERGWRRRVEEGRQDVLATEYR